MVTNFEKVLVTGSLLKDKALELANELNMGGFQASEGGLKMKKKKTTVFRFGNFHLIFTIAC